MLRVDHESSEYHEQGRQGLATARYDANRNRWHDSAIAVAQFSPPNGCPQMVDNALARYEDHGC
jgi:hypothetical protein